MRIIDMNGSEIFTPDLTKGKLVQEKLFVKHHEAVEAVEEKWHHEVVAEYPNGGKDVKKVVDVPGVEARAAWDEYEIVQRYIHYSEEELAEIGNARKAPKALTVEERLAALEKAAPAPAEYAAGTWYHRGDKVSFDGGTYTCIAPEGVVCVWSPLDYAAYWQNVN